MTTLVLFAPQPLAHLTGAVAITRVSFSTIFLAAACLSFINLLLANRLTRPRRSASKIG